MKNGDADNYRSVAQDSALQLSFGMFGVLLERCNVLMETFHLPDFSKPNNMPQTVFSEEDLPTLLAAVKVWCDWLLGNNDTWFPIVCHEPFSELAKLATHLEKLKVPMKDVIKNFINQDSFYKDYYSQDNYEMVKLGEDALLCGFNPWFRGLDWLTYRRYCHKTIPNTLAQDVRRLDTINDCIDYLEGSDPPILKWSKPDNAHISLVGNTSETSSVEKVNALTHMLSKDQDILDEAYSDEEGGGLKLSKENTVPQIGAIVVEEEGEGINKIKKLKIRKEELERRKREEEEQAKLQRQILAEHVSVTIEICPRKVIPDTNCFVDFLSDIRKTATDARFQLRVPLVVLNELDGLAKGTNITGKVPKYRDPEHAMVIAEKAKSALIFLRERPANTECVTSKGTILPSLGVTTEEDAKQGKTNDDLILDTCISLTSNSAASDISSSKNLLKDQESPNKMRYVTRDVVLLTDDRNLRLKAHTNDIPVDKLPNFIKWAFSK